MVKKSVLIFLSIFLSQICLLQGALPAELKTAKKILDNGLTVLFKEVPTSPTVSVYALVKAGSATEGDYLGSGISHFLEHMLFKGTEKRKLGEVASQVQALGGTINASTGFDYTMYVIDLPNEHFDKALDIISDVLMHSSLDPKEVEKERDVIFGEMRLHKDSPERRLSQLVFQTAYLKHPYQHPVIGYESLFAQISREGLFNYYKEFYCPNNIVLSVGGNVRIKEILPKIEEAFKGFKRQKSLMRNLPLEPEQISMRRREEEYPTDLTRLSLSFPGTQLLDRDLYALDVLAKVLAGGRSSRLYQEVYKKEGLVYSISASNFTPMDQGLFEIEAALDEAKLEPAIEAIWGQIELLKEQGVDKKELEKIKKQVLSEYIYSHQTASYMTYVMAFDEAFTGDYLFSQKYLEGVQAVSAEDIKETAQKYLNKNSSNVVVLKPLQEKKEEGTGLSYQPQEIKKAILENGLTVLLRKDNFYPVVSIMLSLEGGVRQEPVDLNGISRLMSLAWIRGTQSKTSRQIEEMTEALGMSLDSYSGRNSFGIQMQLLPEDIDFAFQLLEDVISNPAFPQEELDILKENMRAEIRAREDSIHKVTGQHLRQLLFKQHPFRLDEEGTLETLKRIGRKDVLDFYNTFLSPENMVLSVFGDIDEEKVLEVIKKKWGRLVRRSVPIKNYVEEPILAAKEETAFMDKSQAMIMIGFHGVALSDNDRYGVDVLESILGSSFSGRLFNKIREELGEAYTLGGSSIAAPDKGLIYFYVLTTKENALSVKEIMRSMIQEIQEKGVPEEELSDVKNYLKGTFKAGLETNAALNYMVTLDELYGLGYQNYLAFDENINKVTAEDVKRLAGKYLDLNKSAVVVTLPKEDK